MDKKKQHTNLIYFAGKLVESVSKQKPLGPTLLKSHLVFSYKLFMLSHRIKISLLGQLTKAFLLKLYSPIYNLWLCNMGEASGANTKRLNELQNALLVPFCIHTTILSLLTFFIGILGQVWYLIVSIPDLCTITYF